jgi:hypothetical protein
MEPRSTFCPNCDRQIPILDGAHPDDALWLHQRRCEQLFPELTIVCGDCESPLPVAGLSPSETLWMHGPECAAFAPDGT